MNQFEHLFLGIITSLAVVCHGIVTPVYAKERNTKFPETLQEALRLRKTASAEEIHRSKWILSDGINNFERGNIGYSPATKNFGESILDYPTPTAFVGLAEADALSPKYDRKASECKELTPLILKRSLSYYQMALRLAEAIPESFQGKWSKEFVQSRVDCISKQRKTSDAIVDQECKRFLDAVDKSCLNPE